MIWSERPTLRRPVMLVAFKGWNDAADAASNALAWMVNRWEALPIARVDTETYFDFQATRPDVQIIRGNARSIIWPSVALSVARLPDGPHDVILVSGREPNLSWRGLCDELIGAARSLGSEMIVTLGALLGDVPHTRPVPLIGTAPDGEVALELGLRPSDYEGPTGIIGVLHDSCRLARMPSVSIWASVPHYLARPPNPAATRALLAAMPKIVGAGVDHHELDAAALLWRRQVDRAVGDDAELSAYLRRLERQVDAGGALELESGEDLAADIELFLRKRDGNDTA